MGECGVYADEVVRSHETQPRRRGVPVVPVRGGMLMLGSNADVTWNEGDIGDTAVDAGALKIID